MEIEHKSCVHHRERLRSISPMATSTQCSSTATTLSAVLDDLRVWWPKVRPGGSVLGDDYQRDSVAKAWEEFMDSVGAERFFLEYLTSGNLRSLSQHFSGSDTILGRDRFCVPIRSTQRPERPAPCQAVTSALIQVLQRVLHDQWVARPSPPRRLRVLNGWGTIHARHCGPPLELLKELLGVPTTAHLVPSTPKPTAWWDAYVSCSHARIRNLDDAAC